MIKRLLTCAILSTALGTAAFAAGPGMDSSSTSSGTHGMTSGTSSSMQNNASSAQTAKNLPQKIRTKLQNAGFTDVKVVPETFAVSAKDHDGDPVLMMIGPHSMEIIQAMNAGDNQTTGSSSSSSGSAGHSSTNSSK